MAHIGGLFCRTGAFALTLLWVTIVQCVSADISDSVALARIEFGKSGRSSLGTVIHVEPGIAFVLVPAHVIADDSKVWVKLSGISELSGDPYPVLDSQLDLWLLTMAPAKGTTFSPQLSTTLLYQRIEKTAANTAVATSAFDTSGQRFNFRPAASRAVAPGIEVISIQGGAIQEGSPIFDSSDRIIGFVTRKNGDDAMIVSITAAIEVIRDRWAVPANKLVMVTRYRSSPTILAPKAVESLIVEKGFNHPRGKVPDPTIGVLSDNLSNFGKFVSEKLKGAAQSQELQIRRGSLAKTGFAGHHYTSVQLEGLDGVFDKATGLVWLLWNRLKFLRLCPSQDGQSVTAPSANECLANLREARLGGHGDWRIPTLEELASLLEPAVSPPSSDGNNGLFLDPIFKAQWHLFWTADKLNHTAAGAQYWGVCFAPDDPVRPCAGPIPMADEMRAQLMVVRNTD
ncbi:DUF1566 domain-containing protein [Bradyrhizobium japonicum]|uniref:Lcl C-terminal domain-containing protein n=1 Tax=Bradyrhizobium japonicum TaxID=375 RepID=UPI001BAE4C40|nr:DUF1566 domain-containing protein [Bradyrhizobium japonicum]MBR0804345.1 DUF1566 domain-containing protein [Bradyrhizobium japonicum]